ncbi:MAG: hypothetical protein R2788_07005 [Saprospiraceae bacterium]
MPTLISNAPLCQGEPLLLTTDVDGEKIQMDQPCCPKCSDHSLLPGLTTTNDTTIFGK